MARRPLLLCAVTVASAAAWVVAPDASAQPQDRVVIALADDETPCAPAALEAVTAALQDVEDVDRAKQTVVIAVAWPAAEGRQSAADGFTLAQYRTLAGVPADDAWLVQRGAYDCPDDPPTSALGETAFNRLAALGGWPKQNVTSPDQLQSLAWDRFGKPPTGGGGSGLILVVLALVALAAVAVVIALVLRARGRQDQVAVAPPPPPPPPPPPKPPKPLQPPAPLGITREEAASQPEQVAPKGAQPFALRPMTTLDGLVGSKLRTDLASVAPERHGSAAVWPISRSGLQCTAVYTEKVPELGEDAEPSIVVVPDHRAILLGVYDGLGGAGSAVVEAAGGLTYNEAFVASRVAREEAESLVPRRCELPTARRARSAHPHHRAPGLGRRDPSARSELRREEQPRQDPPDDARRGGPPRHRRRGRRSRPCGPGTRGCSS